MFHKRLLKSISVFFLLAAGFSYPGSSTILSNTRDAISINYTFDRFRVTRENGYDYFSEDSCINLLDEGKPIVPVRVSRILIPENMSLDRIRVSTSYRKYGGKYSLDTAQRQLKIGEPSAGRLEFSGRFPEEDYQLLTVEKCMGYSIAVIRLFPLSFDTAGGPVSWASDIRLDVTFRENEPGKISAEDISPRGLEKDMEYVSGIVDNPLELSSLALKKNGSKSGPTTYQYVIITNSDLKNAFLPFADYIRTSRGLTVGVFDISDITTIGNIYYHAGRDRQEQIRNFIKQAYNSWQTRYVLLGGYANIIPVRYLDTYDGPVPGDLYYSNLDGDWDYNGNNTFGEFYYDGPGGGWVDTSAEVFVGRVPAATPQEVANFTNKLISYNQTDNWKLKKSAFIGRRLNMNTPSWGGDGMDGIIRDCMPEDWEVRRFYDRDNTFDVGEIMSYINDGVQLITGLVHGNPSTSNGLNISNVLSMRNTDYFINYSQSCNSGNFDSPNDGRCIAEYMVVEPYAAVAFVGNARSGYYSPFNEEYGSSNVLNKEFFDLLFNQNVTILGEAYHRHKDNFRNILNGSTVLYYYVHLFGDPSMPIMEPRVLPPALTEGYTYYVKNDDIWRHDLATGEKFQVTYFGTGSGDILNPCAAEEGSKILFSRSTGGSYSLYSVNSDGSGLENLTSSLDLSPATINQESGTISPDGAYLAFTAQSTSTPFGGKQVWIKELTGEGRLLQLTFRNWNCSYPCFVDDNYILFKTTNIDDSLEDYYLITVAGTNLTNVTNNNSYAPYFPRMGRPSLSVDRTRIIYGKQAQTSQSYSDWAIYTRPLWAGSETTGLSNLYNGNMLPADQPDPKPVFVTAGSFIFRGISPESGDSYLYYTVFNTVSPYLMQISGTLDASCHFYFLPRPKPVQIAYIRDGQVRLVDHRGNDIQLTDTINTNDDPSFDFTGTLIAYSGNGIWIMKANGTDFRQVETSFAARYPAFSPDGRWLVYVKDKDIFARRTDLSTEPQRLTFTSTLGESDLSFSPLGDRILFTRISGGISGIHVLPVTLFDTYVSVNGDPVNLTSEDVCNNYHPSWSGSGSKIIYISTITGSPAIFIMDSDGENRQQLQLLPVPANPAFPFFSPYPEEEKISYLNNTLVRTADLVKQGETNTGIETTRKFSWARYRSGSLEASRQFLMKQADPSMGFVYNIIITPNELNPVSNIILTETIPSLPDASVNWVLESAYWNGQECMPSNGATTGTLKWILGTEMPVAEGEEEIIGGMMSLTLKLTGDGPAGSIRSINGNVVAGDKIYTVSGDAYVTIGNLVMPPDTDGNWMIDDFELLLAIDYWATNSRINGWPVDTEDWDMYLLLVIDFWANDGYEYVPGEGRWRKS